MNKKQKERLVAMSEMMLQNIPCITKLQGVVCINKIISYLITFLFCLSTSYSDYTIFILKF